MFPINFPYNCNNNFTLTWENHFYSLRVYTSTHSKSKSKSMTRTLTSSYMMFGFINYFSSTNVIAPEPEPKPTINKSCVFFGQFNFKWEFEMRRTVERQWFTQCNCGGRDISSIFSGVNYVFTSICKDLNNSNVHVVVYLNCRCYHSLNKLQWHWQLQSVHILVYKMSQSRSLSILWTCTIW